MSTIFKNILPIPYDTIFGSGSYVIPANKYAFFQANAVVTGECGATVQDNTAQSVSMLHCSANGTPSNQTTNTFHTSNDFFSNWLVAGDSITTSTSFPNTTYNTTWGVISYASSGIVRDNYAYVSINGTVICHAMARVVRGHQNTSGSSYNVYGISSFTGQATWGVSLFDIPINNLPSELIVS